MHRKRTACRERKRIRRHNGINATNVQTNIKQKQDAKLLVEPHLSQTHVL